MASALAVALVEERCGREYFTVARLPMGLFGTLTSSKEAVLPLFKTAACEPCQASKAKATTEGCEKCMSAEILEYLMRQVKRALEWMWTRRCRTDSQMSRPDVSERGETRWASSNKTILTAPAMLVGRALRPIFLSCWSSSDLQCFCDDIDETPSHSFVLLHPSRGHAERGAG